MTLAFVRFDGQKLQALRKARMLDQTSLAERARKYGSGLTQASVSRYEHGMEPNGRNALALATALGVDVRELYRDDDDDEEESEPVSHDDLLVALAPLARLLVKAAKA